VRGGRVPDRLHRCPGRDPVSTLNSNLSRRRT
jgi:hypothetical protein